MYPKMENNIAKNENLPCKDDENSSLENYESSRVTDKKHLYQENIPLLFGCLSVRDCTITKANVIVMLLLEFCGMLQQRWSETYGVYFLKYQLHAKDTDYQDIARNTGSILVISSFLTNIFIGLIYDVFGRRRPIQVFLIIVVIGQCMYPFITTRLWFYIAAFMTAPLVVINTNPFVPDLFQENSQAHANILRAMAINLAQITGSVLLLLNSTDSPLFNSNVMYIFIAAILAFSLCLISFHMKDVILE